MPGLAQSLEGQDLGHLRIVAENWGVELDVQDVRQAIEILNHSLPNMAREEWANLPQEAQRALTEIATYNGRLPWAQFTRQYGALREMGPGRRDKEEPHKQPISTAETLWYRALIGRAFFDSADGPVEFAYIPEDLLAQLPIPRRRPADPFGRPARPEERATAHSANDQILDEACSLLAGLRLGLGEDELAAAENWGLPPATLKALLQAAQVLDKNGQPISLATRRFLEGSRGEALALLARAWQNSDQFNELRLMPGLQAEGHWENDPLGTRQKVLEFARSAPPETWWSLSSLVADAKTRKPDFQRPGGDYESWYLRDAASGEYLRGFEHWDAVDGALITYLLRGPLHWLCFVDLASPADGQPATAFRWSRWADALLKGAAPRGLAQESGKLKVDSQGKVFIPRLVSRATRYLVARFCDWLPAKKDAYQYQITAGSLERARKQGLKVRQLVALLKANSSAALPPNLLQALKRWEQQGSQVRLGKTLVLRLGSAAALKVLRASRAARYLGEPLGPAAIAVKPGAGQQVLQALVELGYLGEIEEQK